MNEERVKKNVEAVQRHAQELMSDCPEIKDIAIILNWDRAQLPTNPEAEVRVPASMVFSNRKTTDEVHMQADELATLMIDTIKSMHDRVINALLESNFDLAQQLADMESKS